MAAAVFSVSDTCFCDTIRSPVRFFYGCTDHRNCNGMSRRMQDSFARRGDERKACITQKRVEVAVVL